MTDYEKIEGGVRARFRDLEPAAPDADPNKAFAQYISAAPVTPLGHEELTVDTNPAQLPNIPANCKRVVLHAVLNPITYTDDGSSPSSTHGMIIPGDTVFIYDTEPSDQFLMWAASNTNVRIAYYG